MKSCIKCKHKIDLKTRLKTLGGECVRIKCENCGMVYKMESHNIVKIISLLLFFMVFYLIYYFLNFIGIDLKIRIFVVGVLAVIFYVFWNIMMSYLLEYYVIFWGYDKKNVLATKDKSINKTNQAQQILNEILDRNGFDEKNIKLDVFIDSFEEFLSKLFDCYDDRLTYIIKPSYNDLSCWMLTRRFLTRNTSGELNLESLSIRIYYESDELSRKLYDLKYDYKSDEFDLFLEKVRDEDSYWELFKLYEPVKYEIVSEKII